MSNTYNYNNYIRQLSKQYKSLLEGITTIHNFDTGVEFEIAICETLRAILPNKYGICRGFVVTKNGEKAGDDIIIYDKYRFPSIRALNDKSFARKEQIPVEAVYAYIEAKNSLVLTGKEKNIEKALEQTRKVKELVSTREKINGQRAIDPYQNLTFLNDGAEDREKRHWPKEFNPFFTAIFAKNLRLKSKGKQLKGNEAGQELSKIKANNNYDTDLIIAGDDLVVLPFTQFPQKEHHTYSSPFFVKGKSKIKYVVKNGLAFSIGICSLLYAIDTIRLGSMPWPHIIGDAMNMDVKEL